VAVIAPKTRGEGCGDSNSNYNNILFLALAKVIF